MITAKQAAQCLAYFAAQDENGEKMTPMRVQKMLYFAQGHCLAEYDRPLFGEDIRAWEYGPVVQEIYGKSAREEDGSPAAYPLDKDFSIEQIPMEDFDLLLNVFVEYNQYTTGKLVTMSHANGGPWNRKYKAGQNNRIELSDIAEYFRKHDREIGVDAIVSRLPKEGYIEEGVLVLPEKQKEYYA